MTDPITFRLMNEISIIDQLGTTLFERSMPHGLTMPQFIVLNHFVRIGKDRSPVELAHAIQVTKATMTSTLQKLETKRFIASAPHEKDGRSKRITITALGCEARNEAIAAIAHFLADIEREIGFDEINAILPSLTKLRLFFDARRG